MCMSLKKGTQFGARVIHSGTLFRGVHYSAVSQTFMSTSMEREYRVQSSSLPPSPRQPGRSLFALPEAKRRDPPPSWRSNTPSRSVSQPREASRPALSPSARPLFRLQFGAVDGMGGGGGDWGETSGCATSWGVVWSTEARTLPIVAKIPNVPLVMCALCPHCAQTLPHKTFGRRHGHQTMQCCTVQLASVPWLQLLVCAMWEGVEPWPRKAVRRSGANWSTTNDHPPALRGH